jgi:hypothetical protein
MLMLLQIVYEYDLSRGGSQQDTDTQNYTLHLDMAWPWEGTERYKQVTSERDEGKRQKQELKQKH